MAVPGANFPGAPGHIPGPPSRDSAFGDEALGAQRNIALEPAPTDPTDIYHVVWVNQPQPRTIIPLLSPSLSFQATSASGTAMTVEIQSSLSNTFSSPTTTTLLSVPSGVTQQTTLGPFVDLTTRYFRIRAGDGVTFSDWVVGMTITFNTGVGDGIEYVYENVGVLFSQNKDGVEYVYENVGVLFTLSVDAVEYVYEGDVNTTTPTPRIWFIKPLSGRSGDGFVIYGHGFGAPQSQYSGLLQFFITGVWTTVGVNTWTLVAAGAEAYTANRLLDSDIPHIDMEHNEVEVTIPGGFVPPGYLLRIETNGP